MDTHAKQELERLYELANSATATTNFYNQVYKYIGFIKQSQSVTKIIKEDDIKLHEFDIEKRDTIPKQHEGESSTDLFLKKLKHMDSGEDSFISHNFFKLEHHIYDLIDWYYADDFKSEEASIMLNGKKKVGVFNKVKMYFKRNKFPSSNQIDFNKVYIDNFPYWKKTYKLSHKTTSKDKNYPDRTNS